jgi:hypothetical protein
MVTTTRFKGFRAAGSGFALGLRLLQEIAVKARTARSGTNVLEKLIEKGSCVITRARPGVVAPDRRDEDKL